MFHLQTNVNGFLPERVHGQRGRAVTHGISDFRGVEPGGETLRVLDVGGEKRVVLRFHPELAPVKIAVLPLLKKRPEIVATGQELRARLARRWLTLYDENERSVRLEGLARDASDVSELAQRLKLSVFFDDVQVLPGQQDARREGGLDLVKFALQVKVKY